MAKAKYCRGAVLMLQMSFLYPLTTNSNFLKFFYLIWGLFYGASFILTFIQCALYLYKTPFNLTEEAMVIMNTEIYLSLFINFSFLFSKRAKLYNLVHTMNLHFVESTDNALEKISMEKATKFSDKFAYYWTINCVVSSCMPGISSLIGGNRVLPIIEWLPYDYQKVPLFEITCVWQLFCLITLGIIYGVLDMVFPCIAILFDQQFKILGSNFRNNIYKALLEAKVPDTDVKNFKKHNEYEIVEKALKSKKFQKINLENFKKNIKHHQILLNCCDDLNDILSTFLMGKVGAAIFNTVFMAFSLITTRNMALIFGLTTYVMGTTVEIFIYTYSGQILSQSSDILWSLYESPWYMCDLTFQKMFNIVQMRTSKTVSARAGNYFSMSAPSFITFMKALGSYVALLKEVTERGQ